MSTPRYMGNSIDDMGHNVIAGGTLAVYSMMWGRPGPYNPTYQELPKKGKHKLWRGIAPPGVPDDIWDLLFNRAHSRFYDTLGGRTARGRAMARAILHAGLRNGAIRDQALFIAVEEGYISQDYVDAVY